MMEDEESPDFINTNWDLIVSYLKIHSILCFQWLACEHTWQHLSWMTYAEYNTSGMVSCKLGERQQSYAGLLSSNDDTSQVLAKW